VPRARVWRRRLFLALRRQHTAAYQDKQFVGIDRWWFAATETVKPSDSITSYFTYDYNGYGI
jgi:hypothetical protein